MSSVNNLNIFTFIKDIYQSLKHIDKTSTITNDTLNKRITKIEENQEILIDKCTTIELLLSKLNQNNTTHHNLDKTIEFELLEKMKKINQNEINNEKLNLKPEELTFANVIENNYNFSDINKSIYNNTDFLPLGNSIDNNVDTNLDNSINTHDKIINNIENNENININTNSETLDSLLF